MKIVLAGGTGFLGRPLAAALARDGHDVVVLTRGSTAAPGAPIRRTIWVPDGHSGRWSPELDGADAVVNLAGESITAKRWTRAHKQRILDSRVSATRSLVEAIHAARMPPAVFVSASAVGYYGPLGDQVATEDTPQGSDFLASVCVQWETEASRVASAHTRVVLVRSGLALECDGGALRRVLPPFRFGLGGRFGSGKQYWSWIHRQDWIGLVSWAIISPTVTGPINATAPTPVTNAEFARALGRAVHRPAFLPIPAFALRLILGEMADAVLLSGQRVVPAKAERLGFRFQYSQLTEALRDILRRGR